MPLRCPPDCECDLCQSIPDYAPVTEGLAADEAYACTADLWPIFEWIERPMNEQILEAVRQVVQDHMGDLVVSLTEGEELSEDGPAGPPVAGELPAPAMRGPWVRP